MKRISLFHSFVLTTLIILSSCGSDNNLSGKSSSTNSLTAGQCACTASYLPVCGRNSSGINVSFDNQCIASCNKATNIIQGNCECSETLRVCGTDGGDYTECEARFYHITVKKYGTCASTPY
jgi:hypothetical protein